MSDSDSDLESDETLENVLQKFKTEQNSLVIGAPKTITLITLKDHTGKLADFSRK